MNWCERGILRHENNIILLFMGIFWKFSRAHFSMMMRYLGVSFITGAISHGFFSGTRSLITWVLGVIFFVIWSLLEEWSEKQNSWNIILVWAILAIAIGSVTGGFQHFPDSPERSVWIIPVWFITSLFLYACIHWYRLRQWEYIYILIASALILWISVWSFFLIENTNIVAHGHEESSAAVSHND